jgi:kynurenine formamidase
VIEKTAETEAANGDYLLTVADLESWEAENGRVPDGAWVLLRSGWGSRAHDQDEFLNVGENGPRTPGPDVEASRWLANERGIAGFGTETVGIDAGSAGGMDPPFPLHNLLLGAGKLGLTQLANLDSLPITGALLVVSPLKLVGGTGSPSRVYAFVPRT